MKIAYFDCSAGISGDMCLGAIVDAGVPLEEITTGLKRLPVKGYTLEAKNVTRAAIAATKVDVIIRDPQKFRMWKDIRDIINKMSLPADIKEKGLQIFRRLFEAEGKVHGKKYSNTHLHELGAVDCLVDVLGTLIGLKALGIDKVYSSAVNLGSGTIRAEHGRLPVPAPATAEILKGIPVYSSGAPSFELTTPTGAAILTETADSFISMPLMIVDRIGNGAGRKDIADFPNMLRIFLGEPMQRHTASPESNVTVIETNIDDMNPQLYEYIMDELFAKGALDVYLSQVIMKKSRPGIALTVLCLEDKRQLLIDLILRETTSIGLRFYETARVILNRNIKKLKTKFGDVRIKEVKIEGKTIRYSPEYEDCKRIAKKYNIPLKEVMRQITK